MRKKMKNITIGGCEQSNSKFDSDQGTTVRKSVANSYSNIPEEQTAS